MQDLLLACRGVCFIQNLYRLYKTNSARLIRGGITQTLRTHHVKSYSNRHA
ncbi:hypothetical protein [Moraxella lacunata]|uniref:hypothetical protein n=1 Tax=Moraxella lacunata TaxID=477 RepID=UPI003EE1CDF3